MHKTKVIRQLLLVTLLVVCTLPILAWLFIMLPSGSYVLSQLVSKAIPGTISLHSIRINPLNLSVQVDDFTAVSPKGETVISLSSFYANVSLRKLLMGQFRITEAQIDSPYVLIHIDSAHTMSISSTFSDGTAPKVPTVPFNPDTFLANGIIPLLVDTLNITHGTFVFANDPGNVHIKTSPVGIGISADLHRLEYALNLNSSSVVVDVPGYTEQFDSVLLKGSGNLSATQVDSLYITTLTDTVFLYGSAQDLLFPLKLQAQAELRSSVDMASLGQSINLPKLGSGRTRLTISTSQRIADPTVQLTVEYEGTNGYDIPFNSAAFEVDHSARVGRVDSLVLAQKGGGTVISSLTYDLTSIFPQSFFEGYDSLGLSQLHYSVKSRSKNVRLSAGSSTDIHGLTGSLALVASGVNLATIEGNITSDLSATIQLDTTTLPLALKSSIEIRDGVLAIDSTFIGIDFGKDIALEGTANIIDNTLDIKLLCDSLLLKPYGAIVGVTMEGVVQGDISLSGKMSAPSSQSNITITELMYDSLLLDTIVAEVSSVGSSGDVAFLMHASSPLISVESQGYGTFFKPSSLTLLKQPYIDASIAVPYVNMGLIDSRLSGSGSVRSQYRGTFGQGEGSISVEIDTLATPWFNAQTTLEAEIRDTTIILNTLAVAFNDRERVSLEGSYDYSGNYRFLLNSDTLNLGNFPQSKAWRSEGKIVLSGQGEGSVKDPSAEIKVTVDDIVIDSTIIDSTFIITTTLLDDSIALTSTGLFDVNAFYALKTTGYHGSLSLDSFNLSPLISQYLNVPYKGVVSLFAEVGGDSSGIEDGALRIPLLTITDDSLTLVEVGVIKASIEAEAVVLDTFSLHLLDSGFVAVKGEIPLDTVGQLNLNLSAQIPLEIVENFSDAIALAQGDIRIETSLTGPVNAPQYGGAIIFDSLQFLINSLDQNIHTMVGRIQLDGDTLEVESLKGMLDEGAFEIGGVAIFNAMKIDTAAIGIKLHKFKLESPGYTEVQFDGSLALIKERGERSTLKGSVELLDGLYYKNISFIPQNSGSMDIDKVVSSRENILDERVVDTISPLLDISIIPRGAFVVDNNIAFMDILPDIQVVGSVKEPALSGRARIQNGTISYLQKDFEIQKGVIDFTDPYMIVADLDISAVAEIEEYEVTLSVTGDPVKDLHFELSSSPFLSDDDIMSLMIFGQIGKDLGNDGGSAATALFFNQVANAALQNSSIPIDEIAIEFASGGGFKFTIGEDISRKLSSELSIDTREEKITQRFDLKYKFFENVALKGYTTSIGDAGIDVEVRFEKR